MVSDTLPVQPSYGLHPYQRQVLDDILSKLQPDSGLFTLQPDSHLSTLQPDSGLHNIPASRGINLHSITVKSQRVVAHMPTGAGKTRVACHTACNLLSRANAENKIVVWLASTEELCAQAAEDLARAWQHLGNRPIGVYQYWGNSFLDIYNLESGFLVAGLAKLWAASGNDVRLMQNIAERTAGVIFDEAHQAVARTYRHLTEQLLSYQPPLLGLTATPGRSSEIDDPDHELADMFGSNKVTINPKGHGNPVTYLIRKGYLADPEFIPVEVTTHVHVREPQEGFDYTSNDMTAVGNDQAWQETIINVTLSALKCHKRVLVFCPSVSSVKRSAQTVAAAGLQAEIILGETPDEQRKDTIKRFRADSLEPMVLFNYGVLTAGFDAPRTRCVVVARPTTSLVLYSQMVGRAMRGSRSGGNRNCTIYTFIDTNLQGFGSVAEAFTNWEELWKQN